MEQIDEPRPRNPFDVLPEELWETIIENKMKDSQDIVNLTTGIPELKILCWRSRGRHFSWLIAQIMPLLAPKYLTFNDLLNCRLVSKRWKSAVDATLENHPDRRPYQKIPDEIEEKMLISETHPNYQMLPWFEIKTELLQPCPRRDQIMNSPDDRNPFIGRSLTFTIGESVSFFRFSLPHFFLRPTTKAIEVALPLLQKFGHYIWHFELALHENYIRSWSRGDMVQLLEEFFPHLPSLKSLKVSKGNPGPEWNSNSFDFSTTRNIFPKIELLDLTGFERTNYEPIDTLASALVNKLGVGLKTLKISIADWNVELVELLPALTHLHLNCTFNYRRGDNFYPLISRIFEQLKNPNLVKKLVLIDVKETVDMFRLLGVLAPYQIESLELEAVFKPVTNANFVGPLTIKRLKIEFWPGDDLPCTFLEQLPKLQFLCIETSCRNNVPGSLYLRWMLRGWIANEGQRWTLEAMIRVYCYAEQRDLDLMDFSIWDALPALEMLSVESNGKISRRFYKECGNKVFLDESDWLNSNGSMENLFGL